MKFTNNHLHLQLGVAVLAFISTSHALKIEKVNQKRQVGADKGLVIDTQEDRAAEATGFLGAGHVQAHSKYFQDFFSAQLAPHKIEFGHVCEDPDDWEERFERKDFKNHRDQGKVKYAHVPQKDHYEHGHRKGNEHHFIERHEKAHPHAGEFKTKVRWGDKHGGYGEHFWDYNHAGHGDSNDEGSEQVADYQEYQPEQQRKKRQPATVSGQSLAIDPTTGEIYDQVTGQKFILKPVN